jgi:hypothetical protein
MKLQKCQLDRDAEFYDKFHPTVKDVEANAEEKAENFRKDPKQEAGFRSFRKIWIWLKLEKQMMKRKICQFNA